MKKIVIIILVAIVPLLTIAQKRSKKEDKRATTQQMKKSEANVEYMVIRGVERPIKMRENENSNKLTEAGDNEFEMRRMLKPGKLMIIFDYGDVRNDEIVEMRRIANSLRSMVAAANAAAKKGWEFISANTVSNIKSTSHYYYMKRNK
jgi:hypothetical protein